MSTGERYLRDTTQPRAVLGTAARRPPERLLTIREWREWRAHAAFAALLHELRALRAAGITAQDDEGVLHEDARRLLARLANTATEQMEDAVRALHALRMGAARPQD